MVSHLDKSDSRQAETLAEVYRSSHLFLFPTRADCTPLVIGEANAYGLPVLASDVGGISSLVRDGHNGYLIADTADSADAYVRRIVECLRSPTDYQALALSARAEYESRLNWGVGAAALYHICREAV